MNTLDLVLCNDETVSGVRTAKEFVKNDHLPVCFSVQLPEISSSVGKRDASVNFDYKMGDYEMIKLNLALTNWNTFFQHRTNVDEMYSGLVDYLLMLRSLHVPQKSTARKSSGVDAHVEKLLSMLENETDTTKQERLRRDLNRAIKRQRTLEEHKIVSSRDPKSFYNYVNLRLTPNDHLAALIDNAGNAITDDLDKAELLKTHCESSYPTAEEVTRRDANPGSQLFVKPELRMTDEVDSSPWNLYRHLRKLKNSCAASPDSIPATLLNACGYEACVPLSIIFERTLRDGTLPDVFREAIIIPIHKRGDKTEVVHKRNVSLTCASCKVFESVVAETILDNAAEQGLLCREQFAYRKGYSCCTQLLVYQNELAKFIHQRGRQF